MSWKVCRASIARVVGLSCGALAAILSACGDDGAGGSGAGASGGGGDGGGATHCAPGETEVCYGGPAGTDGIGLCRAGVRTCAEGGASWGPCEGEVLPAAEICESVDDEDCDGAADCGGQHLWSLRAGDSQWQGGLGVAFDPEGNALVTGSFEGAIDLGGGPLQSAGQEDVFVAKLAPDGALLWAQRFGGPGRDEAYGVAVDAQGDLVVAGTFDGVIDFGGGPLLAVGGELDGFVAKLGAQGGHVWSKRFGDDLIQVINDVAVTADGGAVLVGFGAGAIDFGGGPLATAGGGDAFAVKLDAAGAHVWSRVFGDSAEQGAFGVAVDGAGDVLVTGYMLGSIDLGAGSVLTTDAGDDIFVLKLDAAGAPIWGRGFGDSNTQVGFDVAADAAGDVVLTGWISGATDFGGGPLQSAISDAFVAKLDAAGDHVWSRLLPGDYGYGRRVAVDGAGDVIVVGSRSADVLLARFGSDGAVRYERTYGTDGEQQGHAVAVDGAGNVLVAGFFELSLDLGGGALVSAGGQDLFVAELGP